MKECVLTDEMTSAYQVAYPPKRFKDDVICTYTCTTSDYADTTEQLAAQYNTEADSPQHWTVPNAGIVLPNPPTP